MAKIFYFSSTGNGLYIGKKIKEQLKDIELISIPKCENYIIEDDFVGFIFPVHCFGLPIVVEQFLKKLQFKSKNPYIFAAQATGGGHTNNGFNFLNNELKKHGLKLSNYAEFKFISNYTKAGKNPTKERALEAISKIDPLLDKFILDLKSKNIKEFSEKPNGLTNFVHSMWIEKFKNKDKKFIVNETCISCNMCKNICPTNNIILVDGKPTWNGNCTDCMGCINICPKKAINLGNKTASKERYINPFINRKDLI